MGLELDLDPEDAVPLYRQIASRLRYAIATGRLEAGTRLPSLRAAADAWDVNLHTVRRGYGLLEEAGLIRTSVPAGSIVNESLSDTERVSSVRAFVHQVAEEAEARFGLSRGGLAELLGQRERAPGEQPVTVMECSRTLSRRLAEEIRLVYAGDVVPSTIGESAPPPGGPVVTTYFHYAELRGVLARREGEAIFVAIRPAPLFLSEFSRHIGDAGRAVLLETDELLAHNLKLELLATVGADLEIETRIPPDPRRAVAEIPDSIPILVSPRNWDVLAEAGVDDPRLIEVEYAIEPADLARLERVLGSRS